MPVTPFHFGPGALVAVASRGSVSFLSFCAVNVLIDVESLYNMLSHQPRIHTFLHTYLGATLAAGLTILTFFPARWLAKHLPEWTILSWQHLRATAVIAGALIGAWSHVLFDSIMHGDITPWAPFSDFNPSYRIVSLGALHLSCLVAGGAGFALWAFRSNKSLERTREK